MSRKTIIPSQRIWCWSLWFESANSNMPLRWLWGLFPPNMANVLAIYKCKSVAALSCSSLGMIKISFTSETARGSWCPENVLYLFQTVSDSQNWHFFTWYFASNVTLSDLLLAFAFFTVFVLFCLHHKQQIEQWTRLRTKVGILWSLWTLRSVYSQKGSRL